MDLPRWKCRNHQVMARRPGKRANQTRAGVDERGPDVMNKTLVTGFGPLRSRGKFCAARPRAALSSPRAKAPLLYASGEAVRQHSGTTGCARTQASMREQLSRKPSADNSAAQAEPTTPAAVSHSDSP